jgi:GT2 family glycosyltransferase
MRLAVVIVNTNEGEFLPRALGALERQTLRPARTILVDNASTDGSVEMARQQFGWVEVLQPGRNVGFAVANNLGVRAADDCELVALLNPDAFAEPGWAEALVAAAREHPGCAAFASQMVSAREPELLDGAGDAYHVSGLAWRLEGGLRRAESEHAKRPGEVFSACAGAALYRRDAFLDAGGFDESFFGYFEDTDLAFRLRLAGHGVRYVPDALVHHVGSGTTGVASDYTIYHSHRNMVWAWAKNMPWPLVAAYLPVHVAVNVLSVAAYARRGQGGLVLRAKLDALRGLPRVLRERRQLQRGRRAGALALRRLMATGREGLVAMPAIERALPRVAARRTR